MTMCCRGGSAFHGQGLNQGHASARGVEVRLVAVNGRFSFLDSAFLEIFIGLAECSVPAGTFAGFKVARGGAGAGICHIIGGSQDIYLS